ncbi:MAG: asparagine synthase C-terminal domain-containing protein [Deltaproteobacteria bacterium]|jgi:asparagine synthase (glutamine-hydrolysing)|nr:asparagine synthase C-terminal domain-containing protein [Deltaproteobacteria bacterium]
MSITIFDDGCVYHPELITGLEETKDWCLVRGQIFSSEALDPLVKVIADPKILNFSESDASIISYKSRDGLVLIRDNCGATPLYFAKSGVSWIASFDLKSLFERLGKVPPPREDTLYDFLATHYRYVFRIPERTFHEGVYQVPAGHVVRISGDSFKIEPWLELSFDPLACSLTRQEAADHYLNSLRKNVVDRLEKLKGKFNFTISSGLDSSTVAALASEYLKEPIECWYTAYSSAKGTPYDETEGVKALVTAKGWKLNSLELHAPDLLNETFALMEKTLSPSITVTWLSNYILAKKARERGVEYLFSGLGGDESLAGEFEHFFLFFADLYSSGQTELLERETQAWIQLHDHPVFKKSHAVRDAYFSRNIDFNTMEIRVDRERYSQNLGYFSPDWVKAMEDALPPPPMPTPYPFFLSNRLYQEMSYETSPPTLWSEALSSKAGGVKEIFPMASPKLFRLALSVPGTYKYQDGLTKMLLRRSTKELLPDVTRLNPVKTGFNAPLDLWLKDRQVAKSVLELLEDSKLSKTGWLLKDSPKRIVTEHLEGTHNHMMLLWPLISTAIFLK